MNTLRRNAVANIGGRAATALLWVLVTPFVLKRLGSEAFGIWALFFAFGGYLVVLDLGVGAAMIRFIAAGRASGNREVLARTVRRGFRLSLGLGLFWALLIALTRGWIAHMFHVPAAMTPETVQALLIFAIGVLLMFPAQVLLGSLQGFERLDLSNLCMVLGVAVQVLALYVVLAAGGGLKHAALAGVVGQAMTGLPAAVMLRKQLRDAPVGEQGPEPTWRELLAFGAALQLASFLVFFLLQSGKIMLGLLGNLAMVSEYEIAFRVTNAVASLPVLILGAVIPAVSRAWQNDERATVASLFTSTTRWLFSQTVIALGLLWLIAPDVTRIWLGPGYDHIAFLIRLWVLAYAAVLTWSPGAAVARGIGMPWFEVWSLVASLVTMIGMSIWSVPRFGTAGAIAALAVSFGVGFVVFVATFHRRSGIAFWPWLSQELVPRVVAGSLVVAVCSWMFADAGLARHLPQPGWTHGSVVAVLFLTLFILCFAPLGDTQRMSRTLWQMTAGALARRHGSTSP